MARLERSVVAIVLGTQAAVGLYMTAMSLTVRVGWLGLIISAGGFAFLVVGWRRAQWELFLAAAAFIFLGGIVSFLPILMNPLL